MNIDDFLKTADKPAVYTLKYGPVRLPLTDSRMISDALRTCAPKQYGLVIERSVGVVTPSGTCRSLSFCGGIMDLYMVCGSERFVYESRMDFDTAVDTMTAFYEKSVVPRCLFWDKYYSGSADDASFELVTTDDTYRFVGFDDVVTALSRIDSGTISMFLLRTPSGRGGYFEVSRGEGSYLLEVTQGLSGKGFRTKCTDRSRLLEWLRDFFENTVYPDFDDAWTEFDVEEYYKSLMDKFKDNGE